MQINILWRNWTYLIVGSFKLIQNCSHILMNLFKPYSFSGYALIMYVGPKESLMGSQGRPYVHKY